ncbi:MAG: non-DNA binding response regulator [Paenibacillus sp.]|nr:non-DNA binding response regulator [Paenibacillus sp.]
MSMQLLQENVETNHLFGMLNRVLVESNETLCGFIAVKIALDENGLNRLKQRLALPAPDNEAQFLYEAEGGMLAILLPDQKLSYTHYVSLSVKQFVQNEQAAGSPIVIASFPECGVPREADIRTIYAMTADEADYEDTILIYNQPENMRKHSTILIVDEDETVGELLDTRLRMKGYEVFMANNGLDGLRLYNALTPDMVITELSLPALDGYDLIRSIRKRKIAKEECSILVLSENRVERDISACFELGVSDYIRKPYSPVELEARVRRLLG